MNRTPVRLFVLTISQLDADFPADPAQDKITG